MWVARCSQYCNKLFTEKISHESYICIYLFHNIRATCLFRMLITSYVLQRHVKDSSFCFSNSWMTFQEAFGMLFIEARDVIMLLTKNKLIRDIRHYLNLYKVQGYKGKEQRFPNITSL